MINFPLKPAGDFSHIASHTDKALQTDNQHLRMEHGSDPAQKWVKLITFCRTGLCHVQLPQNLSHWHRATMAALAVKATRMAFNYIFPHNSSLNEFSSAAFRSKWEGGVRLKPHVFSVLCWSSSRNIKQLQKRPRVYSSFPSVTQRWLYTSFQIVSVLFFKAESWQQSLQSNSGSDTWGYTFVDKCPGDF